jgi:CO/xanthine dehydrogenase Mo-binding subunit
MSMTHLSRREIIEATGALVVGFSLPRPTDAAPSPQAFGSPADLPRSTEPESLDSWIAIGRDGQVTVFTGRIDMGTGTETVLAQFVAEELDVLFERVHVVMGDTRLTPNQGKSTASFNVVRGSQPLRVAAAEARAALLRMAAEKLRVSATELAVVDGMVRPKSGANGNGISYGELIGNGNFSITLEVAGTSEEDISRGIMLKPKAPLKAFKDYKVVGKAIPRVDLPAKIAGTFEYVHNVRVPGMLHGRVVRPPAVAAKLVSVTPESIAQIPGANVVRRNDFLGVVAPREEDAIKAAQALKAEWSEQETLPAFENLFEELRRRPVLGQQMSYDRGDIQAGLARGNTKHKATYDFAFQDHAMIGPSCAVADVRGDRAVIWSGSQWPQGDRSDIAKMLGMPLVNVHLIWKEASGSYGRLGCDDAAADAAVMSQIVGRPVRVQWMREDEHRWEPLSPAMSMTIEGAVDANGRITAFDYVQYSPSHSTGEKGNHLAWRLIGGAPGWGRMSGGAANLLYDIEAKRARNIYVEPWLRGIYLRSPGGIQSIFAYESFIAEIAALGGFDPVAIRLANTPDPRDRAVLESVARMSGWEPQTRRSIDRSASVLTGRGVSLARYGAGESRSALIVDVGVERASGKVRVTHAFMAFDCGLVINPDGALNQVEGGLIQGLSRALHEQVRFDRKTVTSRSWADYPIIDFSELPEVKLDLISRPDLPWSSAGEAGTVASVAAVANAVFDATGKHPRRVPLEPNLIKSLL